MERTGRHPEPGRRTPVLLRPCPAARSADRAHRSGRLPCGELGQRGPGAAHARPGRAHRRGVRHRAGTHTGPARRAGHSADLGQHVRRDPAGRRGTAGRGPGHGHERLRGADARRNADRPAVGHPGIADRRDPDHLHRDHRGICRARRARPVLLRRPGRAWVRGHGGWCRVGVAAGTAHRTRLRTAREGCGFPGRTAAEHRAVIAILRKGPSGKERSMRHKFRMAVALAGAGTLLALAGCGGGKSNPLDGASGGAGEVVVGSANFQENVLLGEIYAQALEAKGIKVKRQFNIGAREIIFGQIKSGTLTILPEYNGALLAYVDKSASATSTADVNAALVAKLPAELELLTSSAAQDKDSVTVTKETAAKYNLKSLPDLAPVAKDLVLGGPPEFKTRVQGVVGLARDYGIMFKEFKSLDTAGPITVAALKKGDVQAANLFTTDPAIPENGFVVLDDPKSLFSSQNVTPLVYKARVNDTIRNALNAVSAKLDTTTLAALDKKVISDKQDVEAVAKEWLTAQQLR